MVRFNRRYLLALIAAGGSLQLNQAANGLQFQHQRNKLEKTSISNDNIDKFNSISNADSEFISENLVENADAGTSFLDNTSEETVTVDDPSSALQVNEDSFVHVSPVRHYIVRHPPVFHAPVVHHRIIYPPRIVSPTPIMPVHHVVSPSPTPVGVLPKLTVDPTMGEHHPLRTRYSANTNYRVGEVVKLLDGNGQIKCNARIQQVVNLKNYVVITYCSGRSHQKKATIDATWLCHQDERNCGRKVQKGEVVGPKKPEEKDKPEKEEIEVIGPKIFSPERPIIVDSPSSSGSKPPKYDSEDAGPKIFTPERPILVDSPKASSSSSSKVKPSDSPPKIADINKPPQMGGGWNRIK